MPKLSIITVNLNNVEGLKKTIQSVINQTFTDYEYIIIDGGSTDNSLKIIKKYKKFLKLWISEPDNGLYHALNKGFKYTTGEIMGWINSDDMLHPYSLFTINEIFQLKNIKWIQGTPTLFDEQGRTIYISNFKRWSKYEYWQGKFKWIQQESTYWHRDLWIKAGGYINEDLQYASDFELWYRFFKYEKLYSVNVLIGGFRARSSKQLSIEFMDDYYKEVEKILKLKAYPKEEQEILKKNKYLEKLKKLLSKTRILNLCPLYNRIQKRIEHLLDYPPIIKFDRKTQSFYIEKNDNN